MGAFRKTFVRRKLSHAFGAMPAGLPARYTFSPTSMTSMSRRAPAALMMSRVAFMISGPMPSPYATVIGVLFAMRSAFGRSRRPSYGPHADLRSAKGAKSQAPNVDRYEPFERRDRAFLFKPGSHRRGRLVLESVDR